MRMAGRRKDGKDGKDGIDGSFMMANGCVWRGYTQHFSSKVNSRFPSMHLVIFGHVFINCLASSYR